MPRHREVHYFIVLYERMCMVIAVARRMKNSLNAQCSATKTAQLIKVIHTRLTDNTFIFRGIDLWIMKFRMYGPSFGWLRSQSYSTLLLRRNRAAARSRSGVVGRTGRNIPRIPSPKEISPKTVRIHFIADMILLKCKVNHLWILFQNT